MPAYNFQRQFLPDIRADRKRHTIRAPRKRRPRVGDLCYLYTGLRTKKAKRIKIRRCTRVQSVVIAWLPVDGGFVKVKGGFFIIEIDGVGLTHTEKESFANSDGFDHLDAMCEFWQAKYKIKQIRRWEGDLIHWESNAEHKKRIQFEKSAKWLFKLEKKVYRSGPRFL